MLPKKYNHLTIKTKKTAQKNSLKVFSRSFSADQKIHPGTLFSIFFQDYFSQIRSWFWPALDPHFSFWISSQSYSKSQNKHTNYKQTNIAIKKQLKQNKKFLDKFGFSQFYDHPEFVLSESFAIFLRQLFSDLHSTNKIIEREDVFFWNKTLQTNRSKWEVFIKEKEDTEFVLKYFIEAKWVTIAVHTKDIATIFADVAVAVNPQDKRYKKLIWQNVIIPIINKSIPIIGDDSVDAFTWSGVYRITPWHDYYGLEIAQKHNLPTNIYAINKDGTFSDQSWEFANKPLDVFLDNIIKYLEDIDNLDYTQTSTRNLSFDKKTGEELYPLTLNHWWIKYSYSIDYLLDLLDKKVITLSPATMFEDAVNYLNEINFVNISSKSNKGILIPIVQDKNNNQYLINDVVLNTAYINSRSKSSVALSVIILNLILNNHLDEEFSLEDLVDILFATNSTNTSTILETYIEMYENSSLSSVKKGLKDLKKMLSKLWSDFENIKLLSDILNNSFAIWVKKNFFYFDFSIVFATTESLQLSKEDIFHKDFLDSAWLLYKNITVPNKDYSNAEVFWNSFLWLSNELEFALNTLLLSVEFSKTVLFSNIFLYPSLLDLQWKEVNHYNSRFLTKELYDLMLLYGSDLIRGSLLVWEHSKNGVILDFSDIQQLNMQINKIWNAYRYVFNNYFNSEQIINIADLLHATDFSVTDYDNWILHWLKLLVDDLKYQNQETNFMNISKRVLRFITDDLCDKYLEASKLYQDDNTKNIVLLSFVFWLELISLLFPLLSQELKNFFNIQLACINPLILSDLTLKEKNYKTNIFMDIVDKLRNIKMKLWLKKHDQIDVFVQASPDFIDFLSKSYALFNVLLNISTIDYINMHQDLPVDYEIDNVINIYIWAKKNTDMVKISKNVLWEMEDELQTKKEHLQYLKALVVSVVWSVPADMLDKKKQEIENLQQEIEELELNISKHKIKK